MTRRYAELVVRVQIESPLAYGIRGDVLFGHLCRTYADLYGPDAMDAAAAQYLRGDPWCVVSDARPAGYLPRPHVPLSQLISTRAKFLQQNQPASRKTLKKKLWVPCTMADTPLDHWGPHCVSSADISVGYNCIDLSMPGSRLWVTINRHTGMCGFRSAAHYQELAQSVPLEITVLVDTHQVTTDCVAECLAVVGLEGYGRWHTSGWGKFKLLDVFMLPSKSIQPGQSLLTLAPCAPQGQKMNAELSWYQSFVHTGKLGPAQRSQPTNVAKTPLLLARGGAVFTPLDSTTVGRPFFGQPIGGSARLSTSLPGAIHQGYAPYVAIDLYSPDETVTPKTVELTA